MGRDAFTENDLAAARALLPTALAGQALAAAAPIKRAGDRPTHRTTPIELAVEVASRSNPDGVPLHAILEAVKEEVPAATGLAVRGAMVVAAFDAEPSEADSQRVAALLGDSTRLLALRQAPAERDGLDLRELTDKLLDDATPDQEWIQAFRRFAVQRLIEREAPR
jgi:hypothetical protein